MVWNDVIENNCEAKAVTKSHNSMASSEEIMKAT